MNRPENDVRRRSLPTHFYVMALMLAAMAVGLIAVRHQYLPVAAPIPQTPPSPPSPPLDTIATTPTAWSIGSRSKPGEVTGHGHLVMYWFAASEGGDVPVPLKTEFGFLVINENAETNLGAKPLFILASKRKKVQTYSSLKDFTNALKQLPRGARLYRYDKCTATASFGLEKSTWPRIQRAFRKAHIRVVNQDNPFLKCTCSAQSNTDD